VTVKGDLSKLFERRIIPLNDSRRMGCQEISKQKLDMSIRDRVFFIFFCCTGESKVLRNFQK